MPPIELRSPPRGLRFELPARPDNAAFTVDARASDPTISIFDVIGLDVTDSRVAAALRSIGDRPVTVQINSPGGDYFHGVAIYNLLRGHSQPVTVQVLGIAASAASVIAMAGEVIEIARNAEVMVHRARGIAVGDAETMEQFRAVLAEIDAAIAETYARRTGLPVARVAGLMAAETFMGAENALALGFADKLLDRDADPKPRVARAGAPQSKRDLEATLRQVGFSKNAAVRVAAGGFPALTGDDLDALDLDTLAARLDAHTASINKLT